MIFGADLVNQHEVAGFFARRLMQNGAPLVVIDTGENPLKNLANCALTPRTGKELDLLTGLTAAISRLGLNKAVFAGDAIAVMNAAAEMSGVSTDLLLEAGFKFASTAQPVIIYDAAHVQNLDVLNALVKLAEISGAMLVSLKGGANSLATAQYNLDKPFQLNGHKAAYVVLGDENPSERLVEALDKVPFLVVQASHASKLTAAADVVLPVTSWLEQDGHYLNADGQLQKAKKSLPTSGSAVRTNEEALKGLAQQFNLAAAGDWKAELLQRPSPVEITVQAA